ncbi:MAG: stage III sporulation protein AG [Lachnospiraceae bacterium]|nr:stage III sporulation protein AG [Lachnospiraceae bacterium]
MGENDKKKKPPFDFKKIKPMQYLIVLFCIGILIVLTVADPFESKKNDTSEEKATTEETVSKETMLNYQVKEATEDSDPVISYYEKKLKKLLEKIDGVGEAEVMITLKSSKELVVLKDEPYTQESLNEVDDQGGSRTSSSATNDEETILVDNGNGNTEPFVVKELAAQIEGVVVIAKGGGDGEVALNIVSAVEVLFGIPAHKVKVLEMSQ